MKVLTTLIFLIVLSINTQAQSIETLIDSLCQFPSVSKAIYKIESGHGKGNLARSHNNIFGIKHRIKKGNRYVVVYKRYETKEHAVIDYADYEVKWIEKYNLTTVEEFLSKLSKFYAAPSHRALWTKNVKLLME